MDLVQVQTMLQYSTAQTKTIKSLRQKRLQFRIKRDSVIRLLHQIVKITEMNSSIEVLIIQRLKKKQR